jgi:glycosyltransferase involved in cell wall biosynthesis
MPRPIAMITHSYYEEDPRVRREAEALVAAGRQVDVFALRRADDHPTELIGGVRVVRLGVQRHQGAGLAIYLGEYLSFLLRSAWASARAHRHRRYGLLQVHSLPDFLAAAGIPLRLAGVPLLLDLHEAMPEFFRIRFPRAANPVAQRVLLVQERLAIALAGAVLTVNDALRERLIRLGVPASKVTVIPNTPSLVRFAPDTYAERQFMEDGTLRLAYAGALSPIYELDVALKAVADIRALRPNLPVTLDLFGRDFSEVPLAAQAAQLRIADQVRFHGRIPVETVPAALAGADVGIAPTRRSAFTDFSLSTKIFEYAAMGKPVIASALPMVERTFGQGAITTYEPGDARGLADAIVSLVEDPARRGRQIERALRVVRRLAWEREAPRYVALVERLAVDGLSSRTTHSPTGEQEVS